MRDPGGKLAIIGAGYLQKPLVIKAKEMGFETHVFAWEEGAVCKNLADRFYPISITEIEEILAVCAKLQPQGVLTIGSDLAAITVNRVAQGLGLIGNSLECTAATTDKYLMRKALGAGGISCPKYVHLRQGESLPTPVYLDFPVIVKPIDRSGSRGVSLVDRAEDLPGAIAEALRESFGKEVVIEQFISGRELSVEGISWKGEHHILQFTDKVTTGPPHFIEMAHHQPARLDTSQQAQVRDLAIASLDALGVGYGASHTEIKINPEGQAYVIELGARMGGDCIGSHLVQLSTGYDYVRGVIEVATGSFSLPEFTQSRHSGIHYVFPEPGVVEEIRRPESEHIVESQVMVEVGDVVPVIKDSSQRPACYIYQADVRIEYDPGQSMVKTRKS